ncbi:helix-hairpin-helix domain-containing protein [Candidatus Dojkabacteria bacterium]|jgi:DNA ligase (NAD+)|nr:helix-hairpin-helix domain-containing protein [Candidatus Dojkabacteria bacterium]
MIYDIEFLKHCDDVYYNTGEILVSDSKYDEIKDTLRILFTDDPYFKTVGAPDVKGDFDLPYILGSLNKVKANGSLVKWIDDEKIESLACSVKLDGVSLYVKFTDGKCSLASTRGDGYKGKIVTDKITKICPVIEHSGILETRCEAVMTTEKALELGYKNARNAVSGIINSSDGENIEYITLVFYHVFNHQFIYYSRHIEFLKKYKTLLIPYEFSFHVNDPDIEDELKAIYLELKSKYPFEIDGLVVANENDATIGEDYYPKNIAAFKVNAEAIKATVKLVVWGVGRTGKMTPVVYIEPVNISGSTISKATGFNAKFIEANQISPGAVIGLQKSGDVIPFITECFEVGEYFRLPTHCPYCDSILEYSKTGIDLFCVNENCSEKNLYKVEHFLLSHGVEEITYTTLQNLGINTICGLYDLTEGFIAELEGFGEKRAKQIINEIKKTLDTTPDKLLMSFGIAGVGNTLSKTLMGKYTLEELYKISKDDLCLIDGIGEVLAKNIREGMDDNWLLYMFLIGAGLIFKCTSSDKFKGMSFALTGKSEMKRSDIESLINDNGGIVKSMSKSTSYLVTDDPGGNSSKNQKARTFGTNIISYNELLEMVKK